MKDINKDTLQSQLLGITDEQAFEWVKTGVWSLSQFRLWTEAIIDHSYKEGRESMEPGWC